MSSHVGRARLFALRPTFDCRATVELRDSLRCTRRSIVGQRWSCCPTYVTTPPPRIDAFALFLHAVGQPSVNILQMGIIIPLFFDLYAPLARLML